MDDVTVFPNRFQQTSRQRRTESLAQTPNSFSHTARHQPIRLPNRPIVPLLMLDILDRSYPLHTLLPGSLLLVSLTLPSIFNHVAAK
jgi:hypothetical protein